MMRFSIITILISVLLFTGILSAQDRYEERAYYNSLKDVPAGILFTDNYGSSIRLFDGVVNKVLVSSAGCGNYFTVDHSGNFIGYKLISSEGAQTPVVYEISSGNSTRLAAASNQCGQPSFADDGSVAFSIGNVVHVRRPDGKVETHDISCYANITALSPDGKYLAYADAEEQIIIFYRATSSKQIITVSGKAYFAPQWSPDGTKLLYLSLASELFVYELNSQKTYSLGEAYNPAWMPDSKRLLLSRRVNQNLQLLNADIVSVFWDGTSENYLTSSPDLYENCATTNSDGSLIFSAINKPVIFRGPISSAAAAPEVLLSAPPEIIHHQVPAPIVKALDIPYVNQVYDTPDWFNGHSACGPATAIMNIAYYNILPKWDGWCSTPTGHYNSWGRYISDRYRFRSVFYAMSANDPNGTPGYGGFGYMWSSGSPYSKMGYYYSNHSMWNSRADSPPFTSAVSEVNSGNPYSICNGLTTSGHIILVHGLGAVSNTVVVNDPYGNKNNPGYPNNTGKNATYDWPGFNNGYRNLNTVYWAISTRYTKPTLSDTLVDDLHFEGGFYLHTKAPASMMVWNDVTQGYNGHAWYTYTTKNTDTCYALWKPTLTRTGYYELFAYIAGGTTASAEYKISHLGGISTVVIDQSQNINSWVPLGIYQFNAGSSGFVRLGDASSGDRGKVISFDAVQFSFRGTTAAKGVPQTAPASFNLMQNYPNPFNPVTTIKYETPRSPSSPQGSIEASASWRAGVGFVSLKVFDVLGNEVTVLVNKEQSPGTYEVQFNPSHLPSGTYFYELRANNQRIAKKMSLLK